MGWNVIEMTTNVDDDGGCCEALWLNDKIAWDCALFVRPLMEWKINWLDVYCNLEVKIQWRKSTRNNLQDIGLNKLTSSTKFTTSSATSSLRTYVQ